MATVEVVGIFFYSKETIWDAPYDLWLHRIPTKTVVFVDTCADDIYIKDT